MPRATLSMAKVVMNDWRLKRVVTQPLTRPMLPVTASVSATTGIVSRPSCIRPLAATTAPSAMTAPTERSMPPMRMTMVMPMAMMPLTDAKRTMLSRFAGCRKTMVPSRWGEARAARASRMSRMSQP